MFITSIPRAVVAVTLALAMAGGTALAQRGDRGGGRGGDGGGRGGDSGGRGGSSMRSSGGGESSARSSGSSRSFSGGQSRSIQQRSGGESSRGSIGRSSDSSRSFSSSPSRSQAFQRRSSDSPSFSRGSDSFRSRQSLERSNEGITRDRSSLGQQRGSDQSRQLYQARRPSEEQLRGFLGRGDDDGGRRGGEQFSRSRSDRDDLRDRDSGRSDFRNRFDGDSDVVDRSFRRSDSDDRDFRGRNSRDGDFAGRGSRDSDYERWRGGSWKGERGEGRDNRDWSGGWRDGNRFATSHHIRDRWRDHDDYPFRGGWWGGRGGWDFWDRYSHRNNRPYYWWAWAAAPRLASWVNYGWPSHYYWDYGPGEYIYYDNGVVYVNGRWYQPAPVFYDRTVQLVEAAPELTPEEAAQMEWLPLGVFAVTRDGVAEPDVLVQLAVTKDGVMAGTAFIPGSDTTYPIEGIVEKETQRAVWSYTDDRGQKVILETSIFNLTQPEATGLVHYGPEQIEVIQLVRLEQPEGDAVNTAVGDELPPPGVR